MKIAYCLSGQPRGIKKASEYVKRNLLDKFDVDIFGHSWINGDSDSIFNYYNDIILDLTLPLVPYEYNINSRYTNTPDASKWPPYNTVSSFFSIWSSFRLLHNHMMLTGIKYDWVIRSRYDYALNVVIPFDQLDNDKLYIPNCRMVPTHDFGNDQFAFGSFKTMRDYMSTYLYLDDYYEQGVQMIGEDMMSANLKRTGLVGEKLVYVNMNNPFPPGPYNGTWHSLVRDDMEKWQR